MGGGEGGGGRMTNTEYIIRVRRCTKPVFLNVYGAQESIPRNEFGQPM
jgi:hypothetical protein